MNWQSALAAAVVAPRGATPAGLRSWNATDGRQRLDIYRNNALVPLALALEESFPVCRAWTAGARFRALMLQFVRDHPPASPLLQDYGSALPGFLATHAPPGLLPVLPELARLELAFVASWHAADANALGPDEFARLLAAPQALPTLRLAWHPATRLLEAPVASGTLWLAHQRGTRLARIDARRPEQVLLTRPDWSVELRILSAAESALLAALAEGLALGEALAQAIACEPAADPAGLLATLVASRAVVLSSTGQDRAPDRS